MLLRLMSGLKEHLQVHNLSDRNNLSVKYNYYAHHMHAIF